MAKGAPKGHPRYGGRAKGTPNLKTLKLAEIAKKMGIDPWVTLLHIVEGNWKALGFDSEKQKWYSKDCVNEYYTLEPAVRAKAAAEACNYLHPKRKAIEVSEPKEEEYRPLAHLTDEELDEL